MLPPKRKDWPEDYAQVEVGLIRPNDLVWGIFDGKFIPVEADNSTVYKVGEEASDFVLVLRPPAPETPEGWARFYRIECCIPPDPDLEGRPVTFKDDNPHRIRGIIYEVKKDYLTVELFDPLPHGTIAMMGGEPL